MQLGRVKGTVVAERTIAGLEGVKLLIVEPLDHDLQVVGGDVIAADTVQAGPGDLIYFVKSREASHALEERFCAVDHAIVGIVDDVYKEAQP